MLTEGGYIVFIQEISLYPSMATGLKPVDLKNPILTLKNPTPIRASPKSSVMNARPCRFFKLTKYALFSRVRALPPQSL